MPAGVNLHGDLGIQNTVEVGLHSIARSAGSGVDYSQDKSDDAFGESIQFILKKSLDATGPTWTLAHFKGPGGLFSANRTDTDKLQIEFDAPAVKVLPPAKGQTKPRVVKVPKPLQPSDLQLQMLLQTNRLLQ